MIKKVYYFKKQLLKGIKMLTLAWDKTMSFSDSIIDILEVLDDMLYRVGDRIL